MFTPLLEQLGASTDPAAQLELYEEAFTLAGAREEQRDGEPVVVYDLDVDAQRLVELTAERSGMPAPPEAQDFELSATYVVDGSDRLREAETTVTAQRTPVETTTTFSGGGEPVEITPPPADQIAEVPGF